jgi:hypothetical protein
MCECISENVVLMDYEETARGAADICYVCLKEEGRAGFYDPACGCKGSVKIHKKCMRDMMMARGSCECAICKRTMIDYCDWSGRRVVYEVVDDYTVAKYTMGPAGKKWGIYYEYDRATGDVVKQMEYQDGQLHGEYNWWGVGGALKVQGSYVYGKRHGAWYEFSEDPMEGYTEVMYYYDELIEYSRYNSRQEKVDYEYYGMASMRRLAAEIDGVLGY